MARGVMARRLCAQPHCKRFSAFQSAGKFDLRAPLLGTVVGLGNSAETPNSAAVKPYLARSYKNSACPGTCAQRLVVAGGTSDSGLVVSGRALRLVLDEE